ncbi:hypothetical protein Tco_0539349 [Tanacetum coccineum]
MDLKLCYNTFKFKEGESLTQTFARYKALMNELVNDGIKLSKLEINTGFINRLPKKWLSFFQSLRNTNHVKDYELASLFGKLKYEENLTDSIYETKKSKSLVSATPLSTAFFSTSIVQDFQDSPDDEEDTRSSQEYITRALLAKSKRFFKKGTQRFSSAKATDQTECHKYGKKGQFARDCWLKTSVPLYQSPFQPKLLHSSEHKPKPRHTKDFEAKYNKVKAKLAFLNSNDSAPSSSSGKHKGLIAETYDWDEKEVSSDDNEVTDVKALMALVDEERVSICKESTRNGEWIKISMKKLHTLLEMEDNDDTKSFLDYMCIDLNYVEEQRNNLMSKHRNLHVNTDILKENQNLRNELKELTSITEAWLNNTSSSGPKDPVFVKSSEDNSKMSITGSNKPKLSEVEDSTLSNHDTGKHPLPPLEKLTSAEPVYGPKTIKLILKSKSTFKAETLKGFIINKPSSAPARGNKSSSASKTNSALAGKLKNVKMEDDPPLAIIMKELNDLKLQISKNKSSYLKNKNSQQIKQSEKGISINKERYVMDLLEKYDKIGSSVNTPIVPLNMLGPDLNGKAINETRYQANPKESHLTAVKKTFCTLSLGLQYPKRLGFDLKGYPDSDCAGCNIDSKSTPAEAEDVAAAGCCANILWIKSQLTDCDIIYEKIKNHILKGDSEFHSFQASG